ncbi:hypothetical protein GCM10010232_06080 [Streptomyces amakusaensis]|uniref:Phosphopantetheine-binding protein n=1 Tax=Streptomyces amakusaensis TaxID=67271 RepID=A0ABW0AC34_9ACTN
MSSVQDRFFGLLANKIGIETAALVPDATLESLDLDSLLLIELSVAVEKEFGVVVDETELSVERTLGDVLATLDEKLAVQA